MIKNLLFDLGGVIVDICRENCIEAFKELGMENPQNLFGEYSQQGPFLMLEEGKISPEDFYAEVRKLLPRQVSDAEINAAFFKFLVGIPEYRLDWLFEFKQKGYKIYLLSNTNKLMWDAPLATEFRKQGFEMAHYIDGAVTSFEAKSCKPDRKIFDTAVEQFGIIPQETLFLDDSIANVEAARKLGFNAELVEKGSEFRDILNRVL